MFEPDAHLKAIIDHVKAAFPAVRTVEEYPRLRKQIVAPAVLVELADFTPAENAGTEQLALVGRFEARVVFDQAPLKAGQKPSVSALLLAATLAQSLFKQGRFGAGAGSAKDFRIEPDRFKPELEGYAVWLVEWTHEVRLGDSIWDGAGVRPTHIWVGYDGATEEVPFV